MLYLDASVFVYANLDPGETGERARLLLGRVQTSEVAAATSALTFDELLWAVKKHRSLGDAVTAGEAFAKMPGLEITPVDGELLFSALDLVKRYSLDPRDSIHAASALRKGAKAMVSSDRHFDKVREVQRRTL